MKINQEREGEIEREREYGENVPLKPRLNRHEPATQPIMIKPRLKFNPTQAKPTTKKYQQPNPKIILLYKFPNPKSEFPN